jgi:hypothetical protein
VHTNYKNNLKSNINEVCTAVARCSPNILDVIVLECVNLSSDKIGRPLLWSNETELDFCYQSLIYAVSRVYFNHTLIGNVHVHWTDKVLFQWENDMICHLSWIQYISCTNLKRRWLALYCNYCHIQCVRNNSTALAVMFWL